MIICEIVLLNQETIQEVKESIEVVSFPDAVREAYIMRTKRGHEWVIKSVVDVSLTKKK